MPTDEMTPEDALELAMRRARTMFRDERATATGSLRKLTRTDLEAGISAVRANCAALHKGYDGDFVTAIFHVAVNRRAYRIQEEQPKPSATRQVMAAFGVGERAAVRLLDKAGAPRDGRRYVYDAATRARIAHTVTTRALRQLVVRSRQPQSEREYRSAQEYARRRVPPIRPAPLTGMALEQAILSIEAARPGHVWHIESPAGHELQRDKATGEYHCQQCDGPVRVEGQRIIHPGPV